MTPALTSIIVVSADSGACVLECIRRALDSTADVELILIDNASSDGMPTQALAQWKTDARFQLIAGTRNLGFGAACNQAVAVARGDWLLFLNPDCLLESDSVARLREVAAKTPACGIVGALVVDEAGGRRGARRRDPTLRHALMSVSGLARWEQRWPALAGVEVRGPLGSTVEPLEAISGACFLMPRTLFVGIGGFDEGYFLHCEDLDLCRRVRDAGQQVVLDPTTPVLHRQGSSSHHRAVFVSRHKHHSMWRWFTKFDPAACNPLLRALVWCGIRAHFGWFRLRHALRNGSWS